MTRRKRKRQRGFTKFVLAFICICAVLFFLHNGDVVPKISNVIPSPGKGDQFEIPVSLQERDEIRLKRTAFTVSYNNFYKTPNWVAWELTKAETTGDEKRKNKFQPDPELPEPRVEHADYTNSGYDRGHMAPAADMKWDSQAMEESFYMSNICPQNRKLNRDDWADLEEQCRDWANVYGKIYIACGPIYDTRAPKRIGEHGVAVPDRFLKWCLSMTMGILWQWVSFLKMKHITKI